MAKNDWGNIPSEEVKKMVQLQSSWEKNALNSNIKETINIIKMLDIKGGGDDESNVQQFNTEQILKASSCLLFAARLLIKQALGCSESTEVMGSVEPCNNYSVVSDTFIKVFY